MKIYKEDLKIETTKGKGPGGQAKNKQENAVRITHIPTGITVFQDGRYQSKNKKLALKELEKRLIERANDEHALKKKIRRNKKIKERNIIRTYDYKAGLVRDHRSKKTASLKDILEKGKIDLLK